MITVFTATYNRGYIIENLYQSLKRQTNQDFEWVVIDDGSVDNTESLFHKWKNELNGFSIKYKKVVNGGKHRAINIGVTMASGDAFFLVDSDDHLTENAIEIASKWFQTISGDSAFAGISGLKGYTEDIPLGGWGTFSGDYIDATNLERQQYGLSKDKAEIYKTSILKQFPFPEFENENFLTEGIVWNKIALAGYKIRWYRKIIYICDYLEDGLTRCGYQKFIKNPNGHMAYLSLISQIYGESFASAQKFCFYFTLRVNGYNSHSCSQKMRISSSETSMFEDKYNKMLDSLKQYFINYNILSTAIYGLGNVGNIFLDTSKYIGINVDYAIDARHMKKARVPVYALDDQLPHTETIIITLKDYNIEVEKLLQERFKHVVYWKDISLKYWVNS